MYSKYLFIYIGADDSPRFHRGNWINFALCAVTALLFIFQRTRYNLTNKIRTRKWNNLSDEQKQEYNKTTKHEGSDRLDFKFRL